jgi:hypothetical protein
VRLVFATTAHTQHDRHSGVQSKCLDNSPWTREHGVQLEAILRRYYEPLNECRHALGREFADGAGGQDVQAYLTNGKLLRALLVFIAGSTVGAEPSQVMCGAKAIELLHTAALVHDDLIDGDLERRGVPALHVQIGSSAAIIVGDYFLLRSIDVLAQTATATDGAKVAAIRTLGVAGQDSCLGELAEVASCRNSVFDMDYLRIADAKTASYFRAAAALGAILGGGSSAEISTLEAYGTGVGIAFQIRDDVIDSAADRRTGRRTPSPRQLMQRAEDNPCPRASQGHLAGRPESGATPVAGQPALAHDVNAIQDFHISTALGLAEMFDSGEAAAELTIFALHAGKRLGNDVLSATDDQKGG